MARVAIIENGIVANVIVAESAAAGVDVTDIIVGPGWTWDGQTFTPPPTEQPAIPPASQWKSYGYAEFIDALTPDEAVAFVQAKAAQPRLEVWVELARVRGINFDDPATRAAAPLLVSLGVLTAARLDELMQA